MADTFAYCEIRSKRKYHKPGVAAFGALRDNKPMAGPRYPLHEHLRAWRHSRGLTLEQVAERIGSKSNTISGWETGGRTVDLDDLKKLADCYGVHPATLLYEPPGGPAFETLREAHRLIERMGLDKAGRWLGIGRDLAGEL